MATLHSTLHRASRYPRSSKYDPGWLLDLNMGPNPLWLLENLLPDLALEPGMRVLDLGSGRGATSVFLAREFGVKVVAADLWIDPADAEAVFAAAGVAQQVTAVRTEAHVLPFAEQEFDCIVIIDAYEYFGTDPAYLPYLARFVRPGGTIAVATPALLREAHEIGGVPNYVARVVGDEARAWHTATWWRDLWEASGTVAVSTAQLQEDGWKDWLLWEQAVSARNGEPGGSQVVRMLQDDAGRLLTFALLVAEVLSPHTGRQRTSDSTP